MSRRLEGKTIALIVAQEFEDIELLYPILRLSEEGAKILVAAVRMGLHPRPFFEDKPVTGRFGHPVPVPVMPPGRHYRMIEIDTLHAEAIDGLVIPGGFSPDYLRRNAQVLRLVCDCAEQGKVLAAICHAPWVLISAGVVRGKRLTGLVAVRDDLINAGAEYVDEPVVTDGKLVTSRKPDDLPEFCAAIIEALGG